MNLIYLYEFIKLYRIEHPWKYRGIRFCIFSLIRLSGCGSILPIIGLSKGIYVVSQMPKQEIIFGLTDWNWKKVVTIGGIALGIYVIYNSCGEKVYDWVYKKSPEVPPISSASRETFDNIAEVAARNALAADERAARIFADGLKKDLAEEAAIKKGELAGKARLALINDAIKHKISQKVIDDVCEEVVPAKVSDVMDKGNLSIAEEVVIINPNPVKEGYEEIDNTWWRKYINKNKRKEFFWEYNTIVKTIVANSNSKIEDLNGEVDKGNIIIESLSREIEEKDILLIAQDNLLEKNIVTLAEQKVLIDTYRESNVQDKKYMDVQKNLIADLIKRVTKDEKK